MTTTTTEPFVHVQTHGEVAEADLGYARRKVTAALRHARDPVLFVRVRLTRLCDPAVARPALAQVNVDLNGRPLRAQAARESMHAALDAVEYRLREQVRRASGDWEAIRGRRPLPGEWRHSSVPTERPDYVLLPAQRRRIVRHKTFGLRRMSVEQAALDMDLLGYQFHLFTEAGTGRDSVVHLVDDDDHYRVSSRPAPAMRVAEAVERLNLTGRPFVFFQDAATRRGCVLYHRYDGHYGLITPAS